jgi:hypothetical protein
MMMMMTLAIGDRREIGLYDVPSFGDLPGLRTGTIFASFHDVGMSLLLTAVV